MFFLLFCLGLGNLFHPQPLAYFTDSNMTTPKKKILDKVKNDLADIEAALEDKLRPHFDLVDKIARHITFAGGKRIRPLLMILSARLCGYKGGRDKIFSTVFEFLHTATLLHDDLVDGASIRRGKPVANLIWGNAAAVLVGDFLLARSLTITAEMGKLELIKIIAKITEEMSLGELLQLQSKGMIDLSEEVYMKIIWSKTAALFQGACSAGAIIANASNEKVKALATYGENLGLAFQMADDLLDYTSSSESLGKKTGADLREEKLTIPVIYAYKTADSKDKEIIKKIILNKNFSDDDFKRLVQVLKKNKGIEYTEKQALKHVLKAQDALLLFNPSETRKILINIADFAMIRKT